MGLTIMFVDDEEDLGAALGRRMERRGYEVLLAQSGDEALHTAASRPDLAVAVLDVHMPGMYGIELLSCLRQARPDLECIMLTAYGTPLCRLECGRWGARSFLTKPVDIEDLVRAVDEAAQARSRLMARRAAAPSPSPGT